MSDLESTEIPHLTTLPPEILLLIIQHLSPPELLRLCSTTRIFQNDFNICHDTSYWRKLTRTTFRIPNHPALAGARDGRRWMQLYRKLRTQTKIYGWGQNDGGCFGRQPRVMQHIHPNAGPLGPTVILEKTNTGPAELDRGEAGVVADLQCGGWSVTTLDASGVLYTRGFLENPQWNRLDPRERPTRLSFPPGYNMLPSNDTHTAIKQFSSGRSHVLGLSDSGRIWSWHVKEQPAVHIKFLPIDLVESHGGEHNKVGTVRQVVAGWGLSSAYIAGTGIVTWPPSNQAEVDGFADQSGVDGVDTLLIFEPKVVPLTGYSRLTVGSDPEPYEEENMNSDMVGEVTNYIVLSEYLVFVTHLGKVFAWKTHTDDERQANRSIQIFPATSIPRSAPPESFAIDVQGSHRNFAILKKNGEVLLGDNLDSFWTEYPSHLSDSRQPSFRKIPALQYTGVVSLAFGDYHFHALHSDGSISSYGHDPQCQGAFGIGRLSDEGFLCRGLRPKAGSRDSELIPQAMTTGRRIVFEEEKRIWMRQLWYDNTPAAMERKGMCFRREEVKAEVSEWIEQKLNAWGRTAGHVDDVDDDDDLPPYFALSIAAAGWHSGALVLVDEEKATAVRKSLWIPASATAAEAESLSSADEHDLSDGSEEVATPAPGLFARALQTISTSITTAARSFLGIRARGHWIWANEGFPQLRLRSGEVMPGDGPVVDWTGPREWKQVEWVLE